MVYDDLDWHYKKDWPRELPKKLAATHTGMFLAWAIDNNMLSDELYNTEKRAIRAVQDGKMTGAEFYIEIMEGKFTSDDLNKKGNAFTRDYFDGRYIDDYMYVLDDDFFDSIYEVQNTWKNFEKLERMLDKRLREWKPSKPQKNPNKRKNKK